MRRGGGERPEEHKGMFAYKSGPICLHGIEAESAGSLAKKEALARRDISPWLLFWSRIGPPVEEVGLGNLAA